MKSFYSKHPGAIALLAACLAAVAVQAPLFALLDAYPRIDNYHHSSPNKFSLGFLLTIDFEFLLACSVMYVVVFGLPLFALLRRVRLDRNWVVGLIGFVMASAKYACERWPRLYDDVPWQLYQDDYYYWLGATVPFAENGVITRYAWIDYAIELTRMGLHGLVGGLVFYLVWRRMRQVAVAAD